LGDSQDSGTPGRDVRALFHKANLGNNRYLTFAAQATPDVAKRNSEPVKRAEETAVPAAPASHLRRTLNSVVEVNTRLRMASTRPRLSVGSGAAMAFASCTGGAGKTTLCATVARALSTRSTNVLVADRCQDGIIPFYFGLERQNAGGLQTVYPSARRAGYQMILVAVPSDEQPNASTAAWLEQLQADASLTLLDLPTFTGRISTAALEGAGQVIIPLLPDIQSVASIGRAQELASTSPNGRVLFLLNRFQETHPLHREIRTHLESLLGDQLAPVAIRESEFVAEALSLGMTVLDHAPQSPVAQDIERLVAWLEERLANPENASEKVEIA
jgi:cellulose synthase operon protein YhjQ